MPRLDVGDAAGEIERVRFEDEWDQKPIIDFRNRSGKRLVGWLHGATPSRGGYSFDLMTAARRCKAPERWIYPAHQPLGGRGTFVRSTPMPAKQTPEKD